MPNLPRLPGTVRTIDTVRHAGRIRVQGVLPGSLHGSAHRSPAHSTTSRAGCTTSTSRSRCRATPTSSSATASTSSPTPDCSDDIQVAANVIGTPGTFDINGGGATWVFGGDGRLVVDDAATTTILRLRFNQRYADADRGGRISIMTVNGDDTAGAATWSPTSTRCHGRDPSSPALRPRPPIDGTGMCRRRRRLCRPADWSHRQGPCSRTPRRASRRLPCATSTARLSTARSS